MLIVFVNRRIGAYHGRPAAISRTEVDVDMPASLPSCDPDFAQKLPDHTHLVASIELTGQIETSLREMYVLAGSGSQEQTLTD